MRADLLELRRRALECRGPWVDGKCMLIVDRALVLELVNKELGGIEGAQDDERADADAQPDGQDH